METIQCQGCGTEIQTTNKNGLGYTPESALEKETILCQRCFRLKHYNETQDVPITDDDFLNMVSSISQSKGLIVHIIDIFDVNGTLIKSLPRITGDNPIILVGNKLDLLPKSTNPNKLIQWLKKEAKDAGIKVKDVFLISSVKKTGIDELKDEIEFYRKGKDVYIVGTTNVGKSTFINTLIKDSTGHNNVITTSYFPGTTLGFIKIPLDDKSNLIDTPGIVNKQQISHFLSAEDLKVITPRKEIKSRVYQLNDQQTLYIGGLARIDFVKGERQSFICYFSNELEIHRTKLENADELFRKHHGKLLQPPNEESQDLLPAFTEHAYKLTDGRTDIIFPGLGWITVTGEQSTVVVHSPKGIAVSLRNPLI
ncbi:ribosome biogenesis GTPase YqeH [Oceanobacillus sp. CAU 1775]